MKRGCLSTLLFSAVLLVIFGGSTYFSFTYFVKGRSLPTPNLVGRTVADARAGFIRRTYLHLFAWNRATCEVVGAYRVGRTDRILATLREHFGLRQDFQDEIRKRRQRQERLQSVFTYLASHYSDAVTQPVTTDDNFLFWAGVPKVIADVVDFGHVQARRTGPAYAKEPADATSTLNRCARRSLARS